MVFCDFCNLTKPHNEFVFVQFHRGTCQDCYDDAELALQCRTGEILMSSFLPGDYVPDKRATLETMDYLIEALYPLINQDTRDHLEGVRRYVRNSARILKEEEDY